MPKISVVMPAYNHERFVKAAIDSVLMQSIEDIELCITDDASRDGTAAIIEGIDDKRIRFRRFKQNRGAAAAINDAIRRSTGDYISVLNSDDIFLSDKLRLQAEFLDSRLDIGAVFGYPTFIDDAGNSIPPEATFCGRGFEVENREPDGWLRQFFYGGNCLCHPTVMIRRTCYDVVGLYDERLAQIPDFDLWLRLVLKYRIEVIPETFTLFRIVAGEGNASAPTPVVTTRLMWEYEKTMRHFLNMDDALFDRVFHDDLQRLGVDRRATRGMKLGLLATSGGPIWVRRFGLDVLFSEIPAQLGSQEDSAIRVSAREFIKLSGEFDLYGVVRGTKLGERVMDLERIHGTAKSGEVKTKARVGWLSRLRRPKISG